MPKFLLVLLLKVPISLLDSKIHTCTDCIRSEVHNGSPQLPRKIITIVVPPRIELCTTKKRDSKKSLLRSRGTVTRTQDPLVPNQMR